MTVSRIGESHHNQNIDVGRGIERQGEASFNQINIHFWNLLTIGFLLRNILRVHKYYEVE